jgi:exosortase/archaeosortase family protein
LIKFFLLFGVFYLIILNLDLSFLNNFLTLITANLTQNNFYLNEIYLNDTIFVITNSCTGLTTIAMFFGLIFAFKNPELIEKIKNFLIGTTIVFLINIFRIIFILVMAKLGFNAIQVHDLTWIIMSLTSILIWYKLNKKNLKEIVKEL